MSRVLPATAPLSGSARTLPRPLPALAGLALAAVTALGLAAYPVLKGPLALLALGCGLLCAWRPLLALALLPALLPVTGLAPWSGRLLVEEYDLLLLACAAGALLGGSGADPRPVRGGWALLLLLIAQGIALGHGLAGAAWPPDANAWNGYLTPWNALRVARGLLAALVLAPLIRHTLQHDPEAAWAAWSRGTALGLIAVGVAVLWERGVLGVLLAVHDRTSLIYGLLPALLDFTSQYRITALFAEMHTGGAAIDGYVALALPVTAASLLRRGEPAGWRTVAGLALCLGLYTLFVTFTRITYVAVALALLTLALLVAVRRPPASGAAQPPASRFDALRLLAGFGIASLGLYLGFGRGGSIVLLGGALAFGLAAALSALIRPPALRALALIPVPALGGGLAVWGMLTSRWTPQPLPDALLIGAALGLGLTAAGWLAGATTLARRARFGTLGALLLWALLAAIAVPALSGYRMEVRFAATGTDLTGRLQHWRDGWSLQPDDLSARLFGTGLGSFPRLYQTLIPAGRQVGSYAFARDGERPLLRLGGGNDLLLGQRIELSGPGVYRVEALARAIGEPALLLARLCWHHVLSCSPGSAFEARAPVQPGAWQHIRFEIDAGRLAQQPAWARWPVTLLIGDQQPDTRIEIAELSLRGPDGHERLANRDFAAGGDRWLSYNEFEHLVWHPKSLPLALLIETGIAGLTAFVLVLGAAAWGAWRSAVATPAFGTLCGLLGLIGVGAADSALDFPRIAVLFWIGVLMLLATPARAARPWRRAPAAHA